MSEFCIVGGGGHARVLLHALQRLGHHVSGYTALHENGELMDIPYLGSDAELSNRGSRISDVAALGVGKVSLDTRRLELLSHYQSHGVEFPIIYAQNAVVHDGVSVGAGSVVLDGAVVVTGSQMGRACIVNTHASIDHDCLLGDDVHVAPGATLSGGVVVGDHCLIGTGANIIHGVHICADALIGAGATVVHDIVMPGIYIGTPARRIA